MQLDDRGRDPARRDQRGGGRARPHRAGNDHQGEGKNRQIRRMCEAVGLEVVRLRRSAVGAVKLGMLQPGQYRPLAKSELVALRAAAQKGTKRAP